MPVGLSSQLTRADDTMDGVAHSVAAVAAEHMSEAECL